MCGHYTHMHVGTYINVVLVLRTCNIQIYNTYVCIHRVHTLMHSHESMYYVIPFMQKTTWNSSVNMIICKNLILMITQQIH